MYLAPTYTLVTHLYAWAWLVQRVHTALQLHLYTYTTTGMRSVI